MKSSTLLIVGLLLKASTGISGGIYTVPLAEAPELANAAARFLAIGAWGMRDAAVGAPWGGIRQPFWLEGLGPGVPAELGGLLSTDIFFASKTGVSGDYLYIFLSLPFLCGCSVYYFSLCCYLYFLYNIFIFINFEFISYFFR